MLHRRPHRLWSVAVLAVLAAAVWATAAYASPDPRITPVDTNSADPAFHTDAVNLAKAIAADPSQVADAQWVTVTPPQDSFAPDGYSGVTWPHDGEQDGPAAIGNGSGGPLASFPTNGPTYGIFTTGDPWFADQANESGDASRDNGGASVRGDTDFDDSVFRMDVNVPNGDNCLALQYRFLSEEFPEFVGTQFNDAFIAEVDNSTWTTAGSTITAPNDFATNTNTGGVSVNSVGPTAVFDTEASGTTYDAATGLVTTKTPITPGSHSIFLSIFDQGDHIYDSAVFADNMTFLNEDPSTCRPPHLEPPPPAPPAGPPPPPPNVFTVGSGVTYKNGATTITVNVPGPGVVSESQAGTGIARVSRADVARKKKILVKKAKVVATKAGPVKLTIRATKAGLKLLKKRSKFSVKVAITFTPNGGSPNTQLRKVTIKRLGKKKHHH